MAIQNVSFSGRPQVANMGEVNFVKTSTGEILQLPGTLIGCTTKVKVTRDGKYEITSKGSYLGAEPKTEILTEEELIARYGKKAGQKLQAVA